MNWSKIIRYQMTSAGKRHKSLQDVEYTFLAAVVLVAFCFF